MSSDKANINSSKSRKRKEQVDAGAYDGRYATKVVEDKKKKNSKESCKQFKQIKNHDSQD